MLDVGVGEMEGEGIRRPRHEEEDDQGGATLPAYDDGIIFGRLARTCGGAGEAERHHDSCCHEDDESMPLESRCEMGGPCRYQETAEVISAQGHAPIAGGSGSEGLGDMAKECSGLGKAEKTFATNPGTIANQGGRIGFG